VTAYAYDTSDQQDPSTTGATARYQIYPGDLPPTVTEGLLAPTEGTVFTGSKILASGRFEDDQQMAKGQVAVRNSLNQYMSASGTFSGTAITWITSFLNSPGSPGSNFSYTSPAIPAGAYTVLMRGVDQHGFATPVPSERHVTVTAPPANLAPVAAFTYTCGAAGPPVVATNVCKFDGRTSTDENAPTLTYAWTYVLGTATSSGSGSLPTKTFTAPGTYTVTLTVKDEYGLIGTSVQTVAIAAPATNVAPVPVINPESCAQLVCNISAIGTLDPNIGDTFTYAWNYGETPTPTTGTASSASHTFPVAGTYIVTLIATDGWGAASAPVTRSITVTGVPVVPTNSVPTAVISPSTCSLLTCTFGSTGSADIDGSIVIYSWNFGDSTTFSGQTPPAHTYANPGTYAVTLTTTDDLGANSVQAIKTVVVTNVVNVAPVAAFSETCPTATCNFTSSSSDTAPGAITMYSWNFGDGTILSGATLTAPSHTYGGVGPYTVSLTVTDNGGLTNPTSHAVTPTPGVSNVAPTATFAQTCTGLVCTFSSAGSADTDGTIAGYAWAFGDGTSSSVANPTKTYSSAGTRTVTLTVTDNLGGLGTASHAVTTTSTNTPPTAGFTSSCVQLACTFTSTSNDADGSIVSYAWAFPDGTSSTVANPSKSFAAGGTFGVTLVVTDNGAPGLTGSVTNNVTVTSAVGTVAFRASASTTGTGTAASVGIPASVVAGDQLLLFVSANVSTTASTPAGWTLLGTQSDGTPDMVAWVFRRTAVAGTGGSTVSSTLGDATAKSTRIVLAYSGASLPSVIASSVIGTASNALAAPSVNVAADGSRVVRFYVNKSADATGWTLGGGVASRGSAVGTGSGRVVAAAGDAAASAGASGSATATAIGTASSKGIAFSVVVGP
ncbi:MAG: domain containing protein, partial [Ilumatobacteraceae bacterium]|nr:domain containing protein [Ilumatobacteraceae bacterium]